MFVDPVIHDIQGGLSLAQAIPVVGPAAVSPVKAMFSVAEIIYGVAQAAFFGAVAARTNQNSIHVVSVGMIAYGLHHVASGAGSLAYSIGNMATFGLLGIIVELGRPRFPNSRCHFG